MPVPYTFGTATASIPLSQLDSNFATAITIGNTAVQLGNTVTTLNNMTLANVIISSGNVTITNVSVTTANVSGTANIGTLAVVGNETIGGNSTISGNASVTGNVSANNVTLTTNLTLSGGTANGVAYVNTSKVVTTGSAITFDGTNFATTGTASATKFIPTGGAATGNGMYLPAANALAWSTNGTEAMRIDSSQNVGIGTSSPSYKLDILTGGGGVYAAQFGNGTAAQGMRIVTGMDSTSSGITTGGGTRLIQFDGTNNVTQFYTNASERMRIDSSGNVGIGTSSPKARLQSNGNVGFYTDNGSNGAQLYLGGSGFDNSGYWNSAPGIGAVLDSGVSTSGALAFYTYAGASNSRSERMRIDSSGFTYTNCTSSVASVSSYSNIAFNGLSYFGISIKTTYASAGSTFAAFINSAGTQQGSIYANATNTVQYLTSSDYRLKENIAPMTGALAKVSQLKPVTYNWKSDGTSSQGFIAHELAEVAPECVGGEKDAVDADGNPVYQGIDTSFLVATLTAALQEAHGLIKDLQTRVATLEAK